MCIDVAIKLVNGLITYLENQREFEFANYICPAKIIANEMNI